MTALIIFALTVHVLPDGGLSQSEQMDRSDARVKQWRRQHMDALLIRLSEPASPAGCARGPVARATYLPSFSVPLCVTFEAEHAKLSVSTVTAWEADGGTTSSRYEVTLSSDAGAALKATLDSVDARALDDRPTLGPDGMSLEGLVCSKSEPPHRFTDWSPTSEESPRRVRFFRAMLDAARANFVDETPRLRATMTLTYLAQGGELIFDDEPSPVRTLRFFGISVYEEVAFRKVVASVKPEEDLVIDLRTYSGAGTMFKPEFMKLDRRKGRTLWVGHPKLQDDLAQRFGVKRMHCLTDLDAAYAQLR